QGWALGLSPRATSGRTSEPLVATNKRSVDRALIPGAPRRAAPLAVVGRPRRPPEPLDLHLHLLQPLPRDEIPPPPVALEQLVLLQAEAVAVDGQFKVELGWLVVDAADDGVHAVAVVLVVAVRARGVGGHVAVAVHVADEQMPRRQHGRHLVGHIDRRAAP